MALTPLALNFRQISDENSKENALVGDVATPGFQRDTALWSHAVNTGRMSKTINTNYCFRASSWTTDSDATYHVMLDRFLLLDPQLYTDQK